MSVASKVLDKTLVSTSERRQEADSDWVVVQRVQAGEVGAFDQLVVRYRERVYGVIYNMTSNREDAADLTQDTFIKAFKSRSIPPSATCEKPNFAPFSASRRLSKTTKRLKFYPN
jgi:hypothetical protein